MKTFIALFIFSSTLSAATLNCESFVNLSKVGENIVRSEIGQKIKINSLNQAVSYITETKPGYFVLEAFIPSLEIRIYSEAPLNNPEETIKTSLWDRDLMFDMVCKKLK